MFFIYFTILIFFLILDACLFPYKPKKNQERYKDFHTLRPTHILCTDITTLKTNKQTNNIKQGNKLYKDKNYQIRMKRKKLPTKKIWEKIPSKNSIVLVLCCLSMAGHGTPP